MSRISLILQEASALHQMSVNIKDILQVRFNYLLSHKGIMLLMLPLTCKSLFGINSLLLMYISTFYGLMHMLTVKPLRCINTLWLGVYVRYTPWNMLDIP